MVKRVGLLGGIGPESTIEYYRLLIDGARRTTDDGSYPEFVIESIDMAAMLGLVAESEADPAPLIDFLSERIRRLKNAGAEVVALASNTPHIVFSELRAATDLELVSIVDATLSSVADSGCSQVALLGTAFTMRGGFYQAAAGPIGIGVVTPSEQDQEFVHGCYMDELVRNVIKIETKVRLIEIVEDLRSTAGLDGVILGGTELPLILGGDDFPQLSVFDSTALHVAAILDRAGYR